jgi:hypothetical protein
MEIALLIYIFNSLWEFVSRAFYPTATILGLFFLWAIARLLVDINDKLRSIERNTESDL